MKEESQFLAWTTVQVVTFAKIEDIRKEKFEGKGISI